MEKINKKYDREIKKKTYRLYYPFLRKDNVCQDSYIVSIKIFFYLELKLYGSLPFWRTSSNYDLILLDNRRNRIIAGRL